MKRNFFFVSIVLLLTTQILKAQTSWIFPGNSPGATDFLGSTNAQDLRLKTEQSQNMNFYTNAGAGSFNNLRMSILGSNGWVGINQSSPSSVLHVDGRGYSTGEVIRTVADVSTDSYWRMFGTPGVGQNPIEFGAIYRVNGSPDFRIQASYSPGGTGGALRFNTNGANLRMFITDAGFVAIGNNFTAPVDMLDVKEGSHSTFARESKSKVLINH